MSSSCLFDLAMKRLSRVAAIGGLLLLSFIKSAVAVSLSVDPSSIRVMELLESGRHTEAIQIAVEGVELARSRYGRSNEKTGAALYMLATVYQRANLQVEAIQPAIEAHEIISNLSGREADAAEMAHTVGLLTRRAYDYVASERWMKLAIRQAEAFHGSTSVELANYVEGLADTYRYQSRYGEAQPLYQRALDIANANSSQFAREIRERTGQKLGSLSPTRYPTAEEELKELEDRLVAAERRSGGRETLDVANAVWELANAYEDRNRYADAITQFDRVIRIRSRLLDRLHPSLASAWAGLGRSMIGDGKREVGMSMLQLALSNREKFFGLRHPQVAPMIQYVASALSDQGEIDQAIVLRRRAFVLTYLGYASPEQGRSHRPEEVAQAATQLATSLLARSAASDEDEALYYMAVSVRQFEQIRANVASLDEQQRALILGRHNWAYEKLAQLLIKRGRLAEAERVLLLLKEANLREFLRGRGGTDTLSAKTARSPEDRLLLDALDKTAKEWAELEAAWNVETNARHGSAAGTSTQRLDLLNDRRIQLEARSQVILREMTVAEVRKTLARTSSVDVVATSQTDLSQRLQAIHGSGGAKASATVAVVFLPGPKGLIVVVTTRFGAIPLHIDISENDLGRLVIDFRSAIRSRGDYKAKGKRLHELLIDPVEKQLNLAHVKVNQLAMLPYGELRDLPFSALVNDGGKHLIERYAIVGLGADGEGGLAALDAPPQRAWRVAGLGASRPDSAFNNIALPGVTREICRVVVEAATQGRCSGAPRGLVPGQRFLDEAFTAASLRRLMAPGGGLSSPSVLHIATHFDVDRAMLLLGDGDKMSIGEISRWGPRLGQYDLVTLSACDTGRTAGNAESLGALFRKYGARAALVTLWPIADVGAEPFMSEFYRQRGAVRRQSKGLALQRAQLALLSGAGSSSGDRPDLSHPYYWAGYLLIGNWQ